MGISFTVLCFLFLGCGGSTRNDPYRIAELKPTGSRQNYGAPKIRHGTVVITAKRRD